MVSTGVQLYRLTLGHNLYFWLPWLTLGHVQYLGYFPTANKIVPIIQRLTQYKCPLHHLHNEVFLLQLVISLSLQIRQLDMGLCGTIPRDAIHSNIWSYVVGTSCTAICSGLAFDLLLHFPCKLLSLLFQLCKLLASF